jgi:hypothetical protein
MAVIKYGSLVTAGSGRIGGHYLSNSLGGATIASNPRRNKSSNANQQNNYRAANVSGATVPEGLIYVVRKWKTLTVAQKAAWSAAAPNFPTVNKLGVPVKPSGYHCFVHINYGVYMNNGTITTTPPINEIGQLPIAFTISTCSSTVLTLNLSGTVPDGYLAYIKCTRSMSAGIKPNSSSFTLCETIDAGSTGSNAIFTAYNRTFGAPITGDTLWVEIRLSSLTTGLVGQPYIVGSVIS